MSVAVLSFDIRGATPANQERIADRLRSIVEQRPFKRVFGQTCLIDVQSPGDYGRLADALGDLAREVPEELYYIVYAPYPNLEPDSHLPG